MLSSRLQREGAISTGDFMVLARALVEALRDVHSAGLLHRDIKPSNIALPESGPIAAKLLDFGLATGVDPHAFSRLTKTDDVVGSLPYVAPEIFDGEGATVQSDLWSLGIVFYEMLSGQRPFKGESSASLMKSILSHEVNWERLPSDLPEGVVTLLKRMLARDLEARPQDCVELLACLYYPGMPGFEESDWSQQHAAPSRPILALVAGALAGALLCALGFVLSGWLAGSDAPAETIEMISHEATRNQAPEHVTTQAAASVETTKSPSSDLPLENSAAKPTQEVPDQSENKAREPSSDPVTKSTRTTLHPGSARRDRKSFQARATKKARTEENLEGDKPSAEPSWQGGVIEDYP